MNNNVYIFGEIHEDVDRERVATEIRKLHREGKIDYILADDIGNHSAQSTTVAIKHKTAENFFISPRTYDLCIELDIPVIGIDNWEKKLYLRDVVNDKGECINRVSSTTIRENKMADMIIKYAMLGNCAVIVEESHIRGLPSPLLGDTSVIVKKFICHPKVKFYSSPSTRLEENGIIKVEGPVFNHHVFKRLITLGDAFSLEQNRFRDHPADEKYILSDFLNSSVCTYCKMVDNDIAAMAVVRKRNDAVLHISSVYTRPEYRENGYISEIFKRIFSDHPKKNHRFELNVLSDNIDARRLYSRLGFKPLYITLVA